MPSRGEPSVERPHVPDYGIPQSVEGTLAWAWAEERLQRAKHYWVLSASRDGQPHAAPVYGTWIEGTLWVDIGPQTRSGRNIVRNGDAGAHLESGDEVVIVEGVAELVPITTEFYERLASEWAAKYSGSPVGQRTQFVLRPKTAFAWRNFPHDATKFRFGN